MYTRGSCDNGDLKSCTVKAHADNLDPDIFKGIKVYTNADLARALSSRRSVSSIIIEINGTAIVWGSYKQVVVPGTCSNITEKNAIFIDMQRTLEACHF